MGILGALGLEWRPREGMVYHYKRWNRKRNLVWNIPRQGFEPWPEGTRSQNLSKVYVVIDGKPFLGTFRVLEGTCTLGIIRHKHVGEFYKTSVDNMEFVRKYLGKSTIKPRFGKTTNFTHHYEYVAKVIDSSKLTKEKPPKQIVRYRGTAIVDTPQGILVVSGKRMHFILPGGGVRKREDYQHATSRELKEETGLEAIGLEYLFSYDEPENRRIRNLHKVFLVKVKGAPKMDRHEVKNIAFWKPGSNIELSPTTRLLIDKYLGEYKRCSE